MLGKHMTSSKRALQCLLLSLLTLAVGCSRSSVQANKTGELFLSVDKMAPSSPELTDMAVEDAAETELATASRALSWRVELDRTLLETESVVTLTVPGVIQAEIESQSLQKLNDNTLRWVGDLADGGYVDLRIHHLDGEEGGIDGLWVDRSEIFELYRFDNTTSILSKNTREAAIDYEIERESELSKRVWANVEDCAQYRNLASRSKIEIKAFYTSSACKRKGGGATCNKETIEKYIGDQIKSVNESFRDSLLDIELQSIGVPELLELDERNKEAKQIWNEFKQSLGRRSWDVAALFIDRSGFYGYVKAILPDKDDALAIVSVDPDKLYALHHEIGHLLGGRHAKDKKKPFNYGRGHVYHYTDDSTYYETIMADVGYQRSRFYSNLWLFDPSGWIPLGVEDANHACVFHQTAPILAEYHP